MEWTKEAPKEPGNYWYSKRGKTIPVMIWGYLNWKKGRPLFTNERGGASIDDYIYRNLWWYGPVDIPAPPTD